MLTNILEFANFKKLKAIGFGRKYDGHQRSGTENLKKVAMEKTLVMEKLENH